MNSYFPLVSICIPTYNAGIYFEPCLQSALTQTYPTIEILISDNGSTDDTLAIVNKYQEKHSCIRLVQNLSKGMVQNWNHCIVKALGEWVKLLFQDDVLDPRCIEKMMQTCLEQGADFALCRRRFIIHDDAPQSVKNVFRIWMVMPERIFDDADFISPGQVANAAAQHLPGNFLGEPTCYLFRKETAERSGLFNPEYHQLVDLEFIMRLGLQKGLAFLAEALVFFRVHGRSESSANMTEDDEGHNRSMATLDSDTILLFHQILHSPVFKLVKEAMGEDVVNLRINHLYQSGCKYKGIRKFNQALAPIRQQYAELGQMRYSFFKYTRYRKLYRRWEKAKWG